MSRPTEQCQQSEFNWVEREKRILLFSKKNMYTRLKSIFILLPFFFLQINIQKRVYFKITYLNIHAI